MKKLLLTGAFKYTDEQINTLSNVGYDITFVQDERIPLDIDCSEFEAVVCNGLFLYTPIEKFENLKFIQATSVGLDRLPMEYINEKNITLKTARGVYSIPMAEWCVGKALELYKRSAFFYENQKNNIWEKHRGLLELNGKTAVIIGAGDIGTQTAVRLKAFGVNVLAVDILKPVSDCYSEYYHIDDISIALSKSDIVIITLPLTEATKNLFDMELLSCMKQGSILINMSRGGIVNEEALINVLEKEHLMGAALDVFEKEPLDTNNNLWSAKNLLITPHNSFVSENNSRRLFDVIKNNLIDYIS